MKEKVVFYTIVDDNYYVPGGTPKLINSFKKFHPDIDLVVFRQDMITTIFNKEGCNFFTAKPYFGRLLAPFYDLVVNIDCDNIILGRLDAVLAQDYDYGAPSNLNDYENRHFESEDGTITVTDEMFLQAGLVASRKKEFWDYWIDWNKEAHKYLCAENDTLNLMAYGDKRLKDWKLKMFDKNKDYYGCKSLNREGEFVIQDGKVMCRDEQVVCYHNAKGRSFPKLNFETMGFSDEVTAYMNYVGSFGTTVRYAEI